MARSSRLHRPWEMALSFLSPAGESISLSVEYFRYQGALNAQYTLQVLIQSQALDLTLPALQTTVKLTVQDPQMQDSFAFWGMLVRSQWLQAPYPKAQSWVLEIKPLTYLQTCNVASRAFYGAQVTDVIQTLIHQHAPVHAHIALDARDQTAYPIHPALIQFEEPDFKLLDRECRRHGVWYTYWHQDPHVEMRFGDHNHALSANLKAPVPIVEHLTSGSSGLYQIRFQFLIKTAGSIRGYYYDEKTGETLEHVVFIPTSAGTGQTDFLSPDTQISPKQFTHQLQRLALAEAVAQTHVEGYFTGLWLQPGEIITLNAPEWALEGEFLVSTVDYQCVADAARQEGLQGRERHRFTALRLQGNYHPRALRLKDADEPLFSGTMVGVQAYAPEGVHTVTPDEIGRIPIRYPFAYQYFFNQTQARYTRVMTESNHAIAGISYPVYRDSELALHFDRGALNRPQIKGAIANHHTLHQNAHQAARSITRLPQGQSLVYSNHLNDQNFLMLNTQHQENTHQTVMLMNNMPSFTYPGEKHLDFLQMTSSHHTHRMTDSLHVQVGEVEQ